MNKIYTYGYGGTDPAILLHHQRRLGALVVDIRYSPHSSDSRWGWEAVQALVGEDNYCWCKEFGNRNYQGGPIELANPFRAIANLRAYLVEQPLILLCGCQDALQCHRTVAANALAQACGTTYEHLDARPPDALLAISLWQPWASLIATSEKLIETRSWATTHRGPLVIHSAKRWTGDEFVVCEREPFKSALAMHGYKVWWAGRKMQHNLPLGRALALADLVDCVAISEENAPTGNERTFGNYAPGRYAWHLANIQPFGAPIPLRGAQQLWSAQQLVDDGYLRGLPGGSYELTTPAFEVTA